MNDYEMMNQRVDQLREELGLLKREEDWVHAKKAAIVDKLLDTRHQITRVDKVAYEILGRQPVLLEGECPKDQAPVDYMDV